MRRLGPMLTDSELAQYRALARLLRSHAAIGRLLDMAPQQVGAAVYWLRPKPLMRLREAMARAWPAPGGDA